MNHPFRVGEIYSNRQSDYEVVSIDEPTMTVQCHDGRVLRADIAIFQKIWENIQAEAHAKTVSGSKIGTPESGRPRTRSLRGGFTGLRQSDFQNETTGTVWRARGHLGGLLARQLSDALGTAFESWSVYRRSVVYLTHAERYVNNRKEGTHYAKFFFHVTPEHVRYGFLVERNWGEMDDTWDWPRFVSRVKSESLGLQKVFAAMRDRNVTAELRLSGRTGDPGLAGKLVAAQSGLAWSEKDARTSTSITWGEFAQHLSSRQPEKWGDLYFYSEADKTEAIHLGADIACRAVEIFVSLYPLYTMCIN